MTEGQYLILHKFQGPIFNTSQIPRVNIQYFSNSKGQYSIFSNSKGQYSILYKFQGSIFNTSQIPRVNIQNLTNSQLLLFLIYIKACVHFFYHQMIALQKLWKMFFISSKELFSFSRYSIFCVSIFPFFFSLSAIALEIDPR